MKSKVYIETSVISYLAARPSRDIVLAAHQQITRDWWDTQRSSFEIFASQLVVQEASAGDSKAAQERLIILDTITMLAISEEATALAQRLMQLGAIPQKAAEDALHLAIAVTNGIDYLLTWNCKHLANAIMRHKIDQACLDEGYSPTVICTPEELMED